MLWIAVLLMMLQPPDAPIVIPPKNEKTTPPAATNGNGNAAAAQSQIVSAELAGKTAALENAHTEIVKAKEETRTAVTQAQAENIFTFLKTLLGTIAGSAITIGAAAKWWIESRTKQKDAAHAQAMEAAQAEHERDMDKLKLEHQNAIELTAAESTAKNGADGVALAQLRKDFDRLEKQCVEDEKKCEDRLEELKSAWIKADAKAESLRERVDGQQKQIIHLQTWSKDFPFASIAADREYRILNVTGNADRNILYPMGLTREKVELKLEDEIWPKELVDLLKVLRTAAATKPGHCAAVIGARFHRDLPPFIVAKILGQDPSGAAWGVQTLFIPMTAVIDLPPQFADTPDAP